MDFAVFRRPDPALAAAIQHFAAGVVIAAAASESILLTVALTIEVLLLGLSITAELGEAQEGGTVAPWVTAMIFVGFLLLLLIEEATV